MATLAGSVSSLLARKLKTMGNRTGGLFEKDSRSPLRFGGPVDGITGRPIPELERKEKAGWGIGPKLKLAKWMVI
jgi:hypothetical protein